MNRPAETAFNCPLCNERVVVGSDDPKLLAGALREHMQEHRPDRLPTEEGGTTTSADTTGPQVHSGTAKVGGESVMDASREETTENAGLDENADADAPPEKPDHEPGAPTGRPPGSTTPDPHTLSPRESFLPRNLGSYGDDENDDGSPVGGGPRDQQEGADAPGPPRNPSGTADGGPSGGTTTDAKTETGQRRPPARDGKGKPENTSGSDEEREPEKTSGNGEDPRRRWSPVDRSKERFEQKTEDLTRKAVTAAATAAGVPAPLAAKAAKLKIVGKVAKVLRLGLVALLGFGAVIVVGMFANFDTEGAEDTAYDVAVGSDDGRTLDIPEPYVEAYRSAARANDIPWTLLAALGQRASDHGRINPYLQPVPSPSGVTAAVGNVTKIFHVGDSLGNGMRYQGGFPALVQQSGIEYQGVTESGKRIEWGTQQLVANEEKWQGADVVVNLGTNDWTRSMTKFNRDIDAFMSAMPATQRVWWLTLNRPGSIDYNNALREAAIRWPNIRILDWEAHALANNVLAVDESQIHYGSSGYAAMGKFVLDQMLGTSYNGGTPIANTSITRTGPGVLPEPTGTCPTLPSPIEGTTGNQGAGPLMLKPSALVAAGYDLGGRVQNICDSADALAAIVAETAEVVAEEQGLVWPRGVAQLAVVAARGDAVSVAAAQQVVEFWAEVVDRLVVIGTVEPPDCGFGVRGTLDDVTYTGSMIYTYWTCAMNNHPLQSVDTVTVTDGVVSQQLLTQQQATVRAVQDALTVSWAWSRWGSQGCDPNAEVAGVFPLRAEDFAAAVPDEFDGKDRCDAQANIAAAAALFASGESAAAAARPGLWTAAIGGWSEFAHVSGPIGPTLFDQEGPWEPLPASPQCVRVLIDKFVDLADTSAAFTTRTALVVQSYVSDPVPIEVSSVLDAEMTATLAEARSDAACRLYRTYSNAEWFAALSGAYQGDFLSNPDTGASGTSRLPSLTTGDLLVTAGTGDKAAVIARRAADLAESTVPAAIVGVTPLLGRLSHIRLVVEQPPDLPRSTVGEGLSIGAQVVNVASSVYGGLYVGQKTASTGTGSALVGEAVPYASVFNAIGQEFSIDPRMLAAIAYQESNFAVNSNCDQLDVARRIGYGMMQNDVGPDRQDERVRICENAETDPVRAAEYQVRLAADKFNAFLRSVGGDVEGALLAYNSGTDLGRYWVQVKPDLEALRTEARRYWCARNPNGWSELANESRTGCQGRGDVTVKYVNPEPGVRSAINKYREYLALYPAAVFTGTQAQVSGNQCPDQVVSLIAGKRLLRDGADRIGLKQLCIDSVAQAATPEAARAIIYVFNNLGKIYDQPRRGEPNYFDCSSYVTRAYQSAGVVMSDRGWLFTTHVLMPWDGRSRPQWISQVSPFDARPGDLAFPKFGHVEMKLAHGFYAHAPAPGDVTHIHRTEILQYNRVNPSIAPRMTTQG